MATTLDVQNKIIGSPLTESRDSFTLLLGESLADWRDTPTKSTFMIFCKKTACLFALPLIGTIGMVEGIARGALSCICYWIPCLKKTTFYKQECKELCMESFQVGALAFFSAIPQLWREKLEGSN